MAETTGISWAHRTWSPWYGCTKVSEGCKHCYAEARSRRWKNPAVTGTWGPDGVRSICKDWRKPIRWDEEAKRAGVRPRVFPSLCDWLEDRADLVAARVRFLGLIFATPHLDWLLLTKRPERFRAALREALDFIRARDGRTAVYWEISGWLHGNAAPDNVWYGVSAEDQDNAEKRLPIILETPAVIRWVSYEPALGPVDFAPWLQSAWTSGLDPDDRGFIVPALDWIVVGGESKQGCKPARGFDLAWARSTIYQGREAEVPVFVKQLGSSVHDSDARIEVPGCGFANQAVTCRHPKGGDPAEWPEDLRVQQYPRASTAA